MRGARAAGIAALLLLAGAARPPGKAGPQGTLRPPPAPPAAAARGEIPVRPRGFREIPSRHYRFWTDVEGDWPAATAAHLDRYRDALEKAFPLPGADPPVRCIVRIFRARAAYDAYQQQTLGAAFHRSFHFEYWPAPERREVLGYHEGVAFPELPALQHECFHEYFRSRFPWPPAWLNEGLAEYFESSDVSEDGALVSKASRGWLQQLRRLGAEGRAMSLPVLWRLTQDGWRQAGNDAYATAWGFVWFLRGSKDPSHGDLFRRLIASLRPDDERDEQAQRLASEILEREDLPALDRAFRAFLDAEYARERIPPPLPRQPSPLPRARPPALPPRTRP